MTDSMLVDAIDDFLTGRCTPERIRGIERAPTTEAASLWHELDASGYADLLVPESAGGAGLSLPDACGVMQMAGRHAVPLPLGLTMYVRAALVERGLRPPEGALTVACDTLGETDGAVFAVAIPFGLTADWSVVARQDGDWLFPLAAARRTRSGGFGSLDADAQWSGVPSDALRLDNRGPLPDWRAVGTAFTAAMLAGAMTRVTEMTIAYANDRRQFGKPISKLQVIQQQISVMAEQTFASRMAAHMALAGSGWRVDRLRAAAGKARASEAAIVVCAGAHAVHGAIGVTEEYDLQLLTRRLHEWRTHYGAETYWSTRLGEAVLTEADDPLGLVQAMLSGRDAANP